MPANQPDVLATPQLAEPQPSVAAMMPDQKPVSLFLGDCRWPEFQAAWQLLDGATRATAVADVSSARHWLSTAEPPAQWIVAAQAWPGQWTAEDLETLRRAAPLARQIGLLGSWCEGQRRTGSPWPGVPRVYWHRWEDEFRRNLALWQAGRPGSWFGPDTSTDEERLLAVEPLGPDRADAAAVRLCGPIAIDTPHADLADFLHDACRAEGWTAVMVRHRKTCAAGALRGLGGLLWDAADRGPAWSENLRALVAAVAPSPVLVLCDFPRSHEAWQFHQAGAAGLFSKPLCWADLAARLRALAAAHSSGSSSTGSTCSGSAPGANQASRQVRRSPA